MSFDTQEFSFDATMTDTQFRAFVQFISNTLEAGGLEKTADTGQIDPLTTTFPVSSNGVAGYEIRAFSDANQVSKPVFFKIEYGRADSASRPGCWITFGTGSDGSGSITGEFLARTVISGSNFYNVAAATTNRWYISAHPHGFLLNTGIVQNNASITCYQRTIDLSGNPTARGLIFFSRGSAANPRQFMYDFVSSTMYGNTTNGGSIAHIPSQLTSAANGAGNVGVYPCYVFGLGEIFLSDFLAAVLPDDFTFDTEYTVNLLGTNKQMRCVNSSTSLITGSPSHKLLQRCD